MKVGVLTSSRADYSIYLPLLKEMVITGYCQPHLIVFGTHLSKIHGYTLSQIENDGFIVDFQIPDTIPETDSPKDISKCMGVVIQKFAEFWSNNKFDLVFALGDRFEMFAACVASLPFGVKIAHIHGGEKTTGAIDDALRHSITHISKLHFTAAEEYKVRVIRLIEEEKNVFNVGALSMDSLSTLKLLDLEEIKDRFGVDLNVDTILITFHPETVSFEKNEEYIDILLSAIEKLTKFQIVITMPNADSMGNTIRIKIEEFVNDGKHPLFFTFESLGTLAYYTFMKHCRIMLGNTSSGFGEASFFQKPVVNLGSRQNGRIITPNIIQTEINEKDIIDSINKALDYKDNDSLVTVYGRGGTANKIVEILKNTTNGF